MDDSLVGGLSSQELTDDSFVWRVVVRGVDGHQIGLEGCRRRSRQTTVWFGGLSSQESTDDSFVWRVRVTGNNG